MGRDDALAAIEMALNRYEGRVAITALHGLRGVGTAGVDWTSASTADPRSNSFLNTSTYNFDQNPTPSKKKLEQSSDLQRYLTPGAQTLDGRSTSWTTESAEPA
jgi:hypothetical protein